MTYNFVASTTKESFFGKGERSFELSLNFAKRHRSEILKRLELKDGDTIEISPYSENEWMLLNIRNNKKLLVWLSTSIGCDDGHLDFVNGWAFAFRDKGNFAFAIK